MDQILTLKHIDEKVRKKKRRVYVGFRDLEKSHDGVNREALWQILRIDDIEGKFLSGTMSMYVNGLACVRGEGDVKECFKIESGVKQGCALSLQRVYGCSDERSESGDGNYGSNVSGGGKRVEIAWSLICK